MRKGRGYKKSDLTTEVKIDDKSGCVIVPPYYMMLAHDLLLLGLTLETCLLAVM